MCTVKYQLSGQQNAHTGPSHSCHMCLLFTSPKLLSLSHNHYLPIYIRNINNLTTVEFLSLLSKEQWEDVFNATDVNIMFKNFLNTYLRCYNTSFLKVNISKSNLTRSGWITKGIKVSCKRKKELFVLCKITNHYKLKLYYKNTV